MKSMTQQQTVSDRQVGTAAAVGRGILAGLAGTVVMTAFQKLVEMPLTGREESYAPANLVERVLGVHPSTAQGRTQVNYATHLGLGAMWGTAYGIAASRGMRGQKAVNTVFAVVYTGDVLANTALGLYQPGQWSAQDWLVDVGDKYVQAQATGAVFDRYLDPARQTRA